ncbi:MAG: alkaline phosphatase family protein [Deltaproteobacteria bacterium]|nr:alkaline phosphatase family protein [Deltaproteobacteria bacterium]
MRRVIVAFGILAFVVACSSGPKEGADRWRQSAEKTRVAIIGVDGATWELLDPLMAAGKLPNFQRLIATGTKAHYQSIEPLLSPLIWTTMVTGVSPEKHGITWFMVRDPKTGDPLPITSAKRETRAIWNIASDAGKSVGFIGWWATWPAEKVNGFMVSDQVGFHGFGLGNAKEEVAIGRTYPEALMFEIEPDIVQPLTQPKADIDRFMNITEVEYKASAGREFTFTNPLHHFMYMLATLRSYEAMGLRLYPKHKPDLFGVFFESIDTTGHLYMKYRPPQIEGISNELFAKYSQTMDKVYERNDEMLGKFLAMLEPGTIVIVCSDHGFKSENDRLAEIENTSVATAHKWHKLNGVLIINGPGIKAGYELPKSSVLDLAPTVLYALGLPVAQDFEGHALTDAFTPEFVAAHPVQSVPTYETGVRNEPMPSMPENLTKEMVEKLKSLGYIGGDEEAADHLQDPAVQDLDAMETHMNRLDLYRRKGDLKGAEDVARKMIALDAADPRAHAALGDVLAGTGRLDDAEKALGEAEKLVEKYKANMPMDDKGRPKYPKIDDTLLSMITSSRGICLMMKKDAPNAEALFKKAQQLDAANVSAFYNYALLLENTGRRDAARTAYEESVKRFPEHSFSLNNLGNVYFRDGNIDKAIEMYERTAAADARHHECRHNWGVALLKKNQNAEARKKFEEALELRPDFVPSLGRLGVLMIQNKELDKAEEVFAKLVSITPDDVRVRLQYMELLYRTGNLDGAREQYKKIAAANPQAAQAFIKQHPDFQP